MNCVLALALIGVAQSFLATSSSPSVVGFGRANDAVVRRLRTVTSVMNTIVSDCITFCQSRLAQGVFRRLCR